MVKNIQENSKMIKEKDKVSMFGLMAKNTKGILLITLNMDTENISYKIMNYMKETLLKIKWKERVHIFGKTAENSKDFSKIIKKMDLVCKFGQMA